MNKLIILSCLVAVAFAAPSHEHVYEAGLKTVSIHSEVPVLRTKLIHEPSTVAVQEHTLAKVGEHVEQIPTAVSHQSQTIVHSKADKITPIVAPAIQTHYAPAVRTVEKQYIENVPVVHSYVEPTVLKSYAAPTIVKSYAAPALVNSYGYGAPTLVKSYGAAPALYKTYGAAPALYKTYGAPLAHTTLYRSELPISQW